MQSMEFPLVFFTVLSQAAVGLALMGAVRVSSGPEGRSPRREWIMVAGLIGLGLVASLFHLGHPTGAPRALVHLSTAWLSREVLLAGTFAGLAVLAVLVSKTEVSPVLAWAGSLVGLGLIFSAGMTYAPPAFPAVNNALPATFFLLSAVTLGAGFGSWFASESRQPLMGGIFGAGLLVALVLYLVVPCVWLSGGAVMRMTGQAWLGSGFYWGHVAVLAACLLVFRLTKGIPVWLPVLLLLGELVGRAGFFADTIHTAANLGGLY